MDTSDLSHHISSRFNEELERVRSKVLRMGGLVEEQLQQAVRALVEAEEADFDGVHGAEPSAAAAARISSAWPSGFTLSKRAATLPSGPIR